MKKKIKLYLKLFISTFYLSAFTFGGGYVIVPLMKKRFVDELKWINKTEMLDLTAIAQSSPGAMAVNASILIGYRIAGIPGALITVLGTVTPPLIIISIISLCYMWFYANPWISSLLKGMQAGIAAIIIDVTIKMGKENMKSNSTLSLIIMISSFIATYFFNINVIYIILICILIGISIILYTEKQNKGENSN